MSQPPTDDGSAAPEPAGFAMADPVRQRRTSATGFLIDAFRRRRIGRATLSGLTIVLFLAGVGMFAYPFITDVYTTQVVQKGLQEEFDEIQVASFEEWEAEVAGETGKPLTKIVLPKLDVATLVVEGTSPSALRAGAGHYPNTPLPGQVGNVAIAGHRTTYGRPFNALDQMRPGDEVWLVTPVGDYRYVVVEADEVGWVANPLITLPKDWSVVAPTSNASLTLTTCHPKGAASQRLILRAELAETFEAGYYDRTVSAAA